MPHDRAGRSRTLSNVKILIAGISTLLCLSRSYVQVQSSSMAKAACDLELWDCCFFGCRSPDHFTVAGASFARCSRVILSLRRHIECVVQWSRAGTACDGPLRSCFLLLLPASSIRWIQSPTSDRPLHHRIAWRWLVGCHNFPRGASFYLTLPTKVETHE